MYVFLFCILLFNTSVHAAGKVQLQRMEGEKLRVNVEDADVDSQEYKYKWYIDNSEIDNSTDTYMATKKDYEHWVKVVAYSGEKLVGEDSVYYSKLPVLYVETEGGVAIDSKTESRNANINITGNGIDSDQYSGGCEIKLRGNSSSYFAQKPYKIKLEKKANLFGMGKNKHWVLISNYMDQCSLRNKIGSELSAKFGLIHMSMLPVDVVINGTYCGMYNLSEQIRVGDTRVDIYDWEGEAEEVAKAIYNANQDSLTEDDRDRIEELMCCDLNWISSGHIVYNNEDYVISEYYKVSDNITGGYLFEMSEEYDELSEFETANAIKVMLNTPQYLYTNELMMNYVKNYWNRYEEALRSPIGYNSENKHYSEYADINSMVTYWLTMEIMGNNDAFYKSRYAYLNQDGKLQFGPAWDFDWGCGSYTVGTEATGWKLSTGTLWKDFIDDPYFQVKAAEEYWRIRPYLSELVSEGGVIDASMEYLKEAGKATDVRYPKKKYSKYERRTFSTDAEVFKEYLTNRFKWLDETFRTLSSTSAKMKLKASTAAYTKSSNVLIIDLPNTVPDTLSEKCPADGLIEKNDSLMVDVEVKDAATKQLSVYVNGIKYDNYDVEEGKSTFSVDASALGEKVGSRNVLSLVGYNADGEMTYTNFVSVIQTVTESEKVGVPYHKMNGISQYDVKIPHVVINQVYGGAKKESYASHSFIELYNPTDVDVDLSSWSLHYRSSLEGDDAIGWNKLDLTGIIPSHCSYLIQCGKVKNPVEGAYLVDSFDQAWEQKLNNKGLSVVLMSNQNFIEPDAIIFDNDKQEPVLDGYVDTFAVSGNDGLNEQIPPCYEKGASAEQSKKKTLRRVAFQDTDDNQVGGDFEVVDYSFPNKDYINYIAPKSVSAGEWEYDENDIPRYKIVYHTMGGNEMEPVSFIYDELSQKPENPSKEGNKFVGWFTDLESETEYKFGDRLTEDVVLYAKWSVDNYTITFLGNGSEKDVEPITQPYDSKVIEPDAPTREKYEFTGWYEDQACSSLYTFSTMPAKDITLYAGWKKKTFVVKWVDYDGSLIKSEMVEYGQSAKAFPEPKRNGYTFVGWDKDVTNVTSNLVTKAMYNKIPIIEPPASKEPVEDSVPQPDEVIIKAEDNKPEEPVIAPEESTEESGPEKPILSPEESGIEKPVIESVKATFINVKLKDKKIHKTLKLKKGKTYKLKVTVSPKGKIKYVSKKKSIVTISKRGKLFAKKKGTARIVISSGKLTKLIKVRVK